MEEYSVKLVDFEEKSVQEVEQQLLDQHELDNGIVDDGDTIQIDASEIVTPSFGDDDVLSYLKGKYNKEASSLDDFFIEREPVSVDDLLPEDVKTFYKFKKETGRGLEDFYRANRDLSKEAPEKMIAEYLQEINPELDNEDISYEMGERFSYDEELDEERDIKRKKTAFKKELAKANKYFDEQKAKYRVPLESTGLPLSAQPDEAYESYKEYVNSLPSVQKEQSKKSEFFVNKTNELFSSDFKGFDFNIGDKEMAYKPGNAEQLKNAQLDITPFFNKFVDENGYLKDAKAYHKAIAVAMNPDGFAKHFYEQGKAEAIVSVSKNSKNIQMNSQPVPQITDKGGFSVKSLDSSGGNRLRMKISN